MTGLGHGCIKTCLDEVVTLEPGDKVIELGSDKVVDKANFKHDQEGHLSLSEGRTLGHKC